MQHGVVSGYCVNNQTDYWVNSSRDLSPLVKQYPQTLPRLPFLQVDLFRFDSFTQISSLKIILLVNLFTSLFCYIWCSTIQYNSNNNNLYLTLNIIKSYWFLVGKNKSPGGLGHENWMKNQTAKRMKTEQKKNCISSWFKE